MAIPSWLLDVTRAAQYLTQLSLESAAQASLILRNGKLWAYAGEISQPAVQELVRLISTYLAGGSGGDLARFIHLDTVPGDFMLYATRLIDGMMLVVVYNVETPFSKIRSQASRLARALADQPPELAVQQDSRKVSQPETIAATAQAEPGKVALPPLFDDVPPPTAARLRSAPQTAVSTPGPVEQSPKPSIPLESAPVTGRSGFAPLPHSSLPSQQAGAAVPLSEEIASLSGPGYPVIYSLYLSCTLVSRIPAHTINGPLSTLLIDWVKNLCLAFGWRLEQISLGEEFLSWVVSLPPGTSPAAHLKTIRQKTSRSIFETFPYLERENPSGDFWAPGYMISSSPDLPNSDTIDAFIRQTRCQQGAV